MQTNGQKLVRLSKGSGWRCYKTSARSAETLEPLLIGLAEKLGGAQPGRRGIIVEPIVPMQEHEAEERSLSAVYGLGELPMHIDSAHHLRPARFLIIGCVDPGQSRAQTRLLHSAALEFTAQEIILLSSSPVLVRTGRKSFYSTILDRNRPFIRYDPGCMEASDSRGAEALRVIQDAISRAAVRTHDWSRGEILLIDNWSMLHGRTAALANDRRLLRVSAR